jgi:hypothetical protein
MIDALSHFIEQLRSARVEADPFPHYYIEGVFPEDYYRELLRHLPGSNVYENLYEVTTLKLDHFRHRIQRDLTDGWTNSLPPELQSFWNPFNEWFLSPQVAQAVLESFAEPLRPRIGEKESWPEVSIEAQFIRDTVPDLPPDFDPLEVKPADACPACGTPIVAGAEECGDCGLTLPT